MKKSIVLGGALLFALGATAADVAPLQPEQASVEKLGAPSPHWIFVYDVNSLGYLDSKVYLYDGDSGSMLGMLSTGAFGNAVEFAPDFSAIYVPEMYYSRGSRGERTEVVTIYDTKELKAVAEVVIPPKRATGIPHRAYQGISDDGRFMYVNNMTPATSVSVVDVVARKFVGEIENGGCNLIYPTGNRSFISLCGDGTVQRVQLDEQGKLKSKTHSEKFFDPDKDPLTERASRYGDTWLFFSFEGYVHPVTFAEHTIKVGDRWSLFSDSERAKNWKAGGAQFNAIHQKLGRLYVAVHQGGPYGHKEPGTSVWVYDLKTRKGVAQFPLANPAANIAVTKDAAPLLIATDSGRPAVDIYDASTGKVLRTIEGPPLVPSFIQLP